MKKRIALFLLAALMLAACGKKPAAAPTAAETQPTQATQATEAPTTEAPTTEATTEAPTQPTAPAFIPVRAGIYSRAWSEEIGGTHVQRNFYIVLNEDRTGSWILQDVSKLSWNESQLTTSLGQVCTIAMTQENGAMRLLVYESQDVNGNWIPTVYDKIERLPAEMEAKLAEAANPTPRIAAPEITKDPTTETVTEGGSATFVARANNYKYIEWYIVSPDHYNRIPAASASRSFPGLSVSGDGTTTLVLSNIPLAMDGWCAEATFTGDGGSATSGHCYVYVNRAAPKARLSAMPSSGYYDYINASVQLTAAPGDTIYYELYDDVGAKQTGTVRSGEYVNVPAISGIRYVARLYAYVVGDPGNAVTCEYTMDSTPYGVHPVLPGIAGPTEAPSPSFNGGYYSNNNDADVLFEPIGDGGFTADVGITRICSLTGTGSYHQGVVYMDLRDPAGNYVGASFDVESGTLEISTSTWGDVPAGSVFYDLR